MIRTHNGVFIRLLVALILYLMPILGLVYGPITPLFGIIAVVELATALTRFSPLLYYLQVGKEKREAASTGSPNYS